MRHLITITLSVACGTLIGLFAATQLSIVGSGRVNRLELRELVLVSESGQPLAKFGSVGDRATLSFLGSDTLPIVEIGADAKEQHRFLNFVGAGRRVIASLDSRSPNGESTLYLGDERRDVRVLLGAWQTDMPGGSVDDWGLKFPDRRTGDPLFGILLRDTTGDSTASISLRKSDGTVWTIH